MTTAAVQQRTSPSRMLAPVAAGAALAAGAVAVTVADPSAPGSRFPGCIFHQVTGLWCPGCGLTRGTHHLFHGDVAASVGSNVFTPFVAAAIVIGWSMWMRRSLNARGAEPAVTSGLRRFARPIWLDRGLPAAVIAYGVLRNIPLGPLRALAP